MGTDTGKLEIQYFKVTVSSLDRDYLGRNLRLDVLLSHAGSYIKAETFLLLMLILKQTLALAMDLIYSKSLKLTGNHMIFLCVWLPLLAISLNANLRSSHPSWFFHKKSLFCIITCMILLCWDLYLTAFFVFVFLAKSGPGTLDSSSYRTKAGRCCYL